MNTKLRREVGVIEDSKVVAQTLAGDTNAFSYLIKKYQNDVLRTVTFVCLERERVEDIIQETFIRAFRYLHTFDQEMSFKAWLLTIAINRCRCYQRKKFILQPLHNLTNQLPLDLDTATTVENRMLLKEIFDVMARLSFKEREVLVLHYIHELSYKEISVILQIPIGTVKSRIAKALERMRLHLSDRGYESVGKEILRL